MEDETNRYRPKLLKKRDVHHDAQLARELESINLGIRRQLGPLPPGGLPIIAKRKPQGLLREAPVSVIPDE